MARQSVQSDYETPKIDKFGRITIPARYREKLKLAAGDSVALVYNDSFDGLVLTAIDITARRNK